MKQPGFFDPTPEEREAGIAAMLLTQRRRMLELRFRLAARAVGARGLLLLLGGADAVAAADRKRRSTPRLVEFAADTYCGALRRLREWRAAGVTNVRMSLCSHPAMIPHDEPGYAWRCADCGYVFGKPLAEQAGSEAA
jgi:hypothetical protein